MTESLIRYKCAFAYFFFSEFGVQEEKIRDKSVQEKSCSKQNLQKLCTIQMACEVQGTEQNIDKTLIHSMLLFLKPN